MQILRKFVKNPVNTNELAKPRIETWRRCNFWQISPVKREPMKIDIDGMPTSITNMRRVGTRSWTVKGCWSDLSSSENIWWKGCFSSNRPNKQVTKITVHQSEMWKSWGYDQRKFKRFWYTIFDTCDEEGKVVKDVKKDRARAFRDQARRQLALLNSNAIKNICNLRFRTNYDYNKIQHLKNKKKNKKTWTQKKNNPTTFQIF